MSACGGGAARPGAGRRCPACSPSRARLAAERGSSAEPAGRAGRTPVACRESRLRPTHDLTAPVYTEGVTSLVPALLLFLSACSGADPAPPASIPVPSVVAAPPMGAPEPVEEPALADIELTLVIDQSTYRSGGDLGWIGDCSMAQPVAVATSVIQVLDDSGRTVSEVRNAFWYEPGESLGEGRANSPARLSDLLPPGAYSASWWVNGVESNIVRFRVDPGYVPQPADAIRLLPMEYRDGRQDRERFLLQVTNLKSDPIDLGRAILNEKLIVDGVRLKRRGGIISAVGDELYPGESWGSFVYASAYSMPPDYSMPPGAHRVAFQIAGLVSPALELR